MSTRLAMSIFVFSFALAPVAGCGGRAETAAPDAGIDAGGGTDAASGGDAGSDAGMTIDGGGTLDDASAGDDAGADAGAIDSGSGGEDACVPPPCARPPEGCHYEGATSCDCGMLVCAPAAGCDPACALGEYCDLCASSPACEPRPTPRGRVCPAVYMPVCGCDGMTYSNRCALDDAGIGLLHDGPCDSPA